MDPLFLSVTQTFPPSGRSNLVVWGLVFPNMTYPFKMSDWISSCLTPTHTQYDLLLPVPVLVSPLVHSPSWVHGPGSSFRRSHSGLPNSDSPVLSPNPFPSPQPGKITLQRTRLTSLQPTRVISPSPTCCSLISFSVQIPLRTPSHFLNTSSQEVFSVVHSPRTTTRRGELVRSSVTSSGGRHKIT